MEMSVHLMPHQKEALGKMHNGCILCGGVGSGKSITAISYYYILNGGKIRSSLIPMSDPKLSKDSSISPPKDLYIITTARKRDTFEWEKELNRFQMSPESKLNLYSNKIIIDSWNNIGKYKSISNAFFIFDEQRVVGYGEWTKSFLEITKKNSWILLSATPGDSWLDYMPVFIANGYYKNKTDFINQHVVYTYRCSFPKVDRYVNTKRLTRLRDIVLVDMPFIRSTESHHNDILVNYDVIEYKSVIKNRWDPFNQKPIENASDLCYTLRKIVNSDISRQQAFLELVEQNDKMIVFYNFNYELDILKELLDGTGREYAEWNGHKHQEIPKGEQWVYLVQYTSGCEGWNCITTNVILFYSQNYSYKIMAQAAGRIDRMNTPYKDLYYYHMKSKAGLDLAIGRALSAKKKFNEGAFYHKL